MPIPQFERTELLYENPLATASDLESFRAEGYPALTFPRGRLRLENEHDRNDELHRHGNFLLWCPENFPDNIAASWDFRPLSNIGLAMFWVSTIGRNGEDLFDPSLAKRDGSYKQYHTGDINGLHVSYFRRNPSEIGFRTCNLRKSHGFHLVARGGDPLPDPQYAAPSYRVEVIKCGPHFHFSINEVTLFHWIDDGTSYGPVLGGGKIGFRQMAGLIAEYANLKVHAVTTPT